MKHSVESTFTFQIPEVPTQEEYQDPIEMSEVLNRFMDRSLRGMMTCCAGVVVGVQNAEEFRVDVRPLPMTKYEDGLEEQLPVIPNVLWCGVGTDQGGVLFTPKQNQTVLLIFAQSSMDEFKGGSITPYSPESRRFHDINDAIAIPSIFPFNRSPNRKLSHWTEHNIYDVTMYNNLGTKKESKVLCRKDGAVELRSMSKVVVDSPKSEFLGDVEVKGDLLVKGEAKVEKDLSVLGDIMLKGKSLWEFITKHVHAGVQGGNSSTLPPTPQ